ncbi:uncharacterized protein BDZ99DRAFT_474862 [Mytilinidion resinicola]|uniref:Rhodopsin domain-containing protein n=1 Tax=Mytilinidion resinicola TaxID=574789 RepID=A0A6A6YXU1_9PEZI|nr:uncharacterized protein BDZ99DRAFT_474862 [Mytilinidion resinicola]KAF2812747.1 hypothetical protein BDZ99DRAFT_474862 [Mytilinidion resinicola]
MVFSIYDVPAMPPPPGIKSNFEHPDTNAPWIRVLNSIFAHLAFVLVAIRLYPRTTMPRSQRLEWDDGLCVLAMIWTPPVGHPRYVLNALQSRPALGISIGQSIKCSGTDAIGNRFYASLSICTTVTVFGTMNTATDFYTLVIPLNRVLKLKITRRKKIGLSAIFLGGLIACLMSTTRLIIVIINFNKSPDNLWEAAIVSPFAILEMNLAIMCGCMTFIPAFFKKSKVVARSAFSVLTSSSNISTTTGDSQTPSSLGVERQDCGGTEHQKEGFESWERSAPTLTLLTETVELPSPTLVR